MIHVVRVAEAGGSDEPGAHPALETYNLSYSVLWLTSQPLILTFQV